jgi:hypothetical protein
MKRIIHFVTQYPAAITALLFLLFYFLPFKPKPFGDGEYHIGTIQLIDFVFNGFQGNVRVDKGLFTLFYYFIPYSLAYVFHSDSVYYFFGILFNAAITCWAIKYLFSSFKIMGFSTMTKFWTIVVLSIFPIHIYYSMGIWAEPASFFAVCVFIYLWVKIVIGKSKSVFDFVVLAFSVVMLIGLRPNLFLFGLLFLLYVLAGKFSWRNKIVFVLFFAGIFSFMFIAEKALDPHFGTFKKEEFCRQLVRSRYELRDEPFNWLPQHRPHISYSSDYLNYLSRIKEFDSICAANNLDKTTYYIKWVVNDIVDNPVLTLKQYGLKFFQSQSFIVSPLMKSNKSAFVKFGIHLYINAVNWVLIFVSIISIFVMIKEKKVELLLPLLFLWASSLLYVFVFHSEQRYMFPARPVLLFLFTYFINYYYDKKVNSESICQSI